jgi:rhodanese-related sulfurtransferase
VHVEDLPALAREPSSMLVDVRTRTEYDGGAIPGAVNIPIDELRDRLDVLPPDRRLIIYCQAGQRGYVATRLLRQLGYNAANLGGGYKVYRMFHLHDRNG